MTPGYALCLDFTFIGPAEWGQLFFFAEWLRNWCDAILKPLLNKFCILLLAKAQSFALFEQVGVHDVPGMDCEQVLVCFLKLIPHLFKTDYECLHVQVA